MPTQHRKILGYMISVDKENWLKYSPTEYFYTKAIAVRYGKQNFFTMMNNCGLTHTPGNPATLYIATMTTFKNKYDMPFVYDLQKPMKPQEAADVQHRLTEFKYHENLIKEQYQHTGINFESIEDQEALRIRKRHQQLEQQLLFVKMDKIDVINFEAGAF